MRYRTKCLQTTEEIQECKCRLDFLDKHCFPYDELYDKVQGEDTGFSGYHIWWLVYDVETGESVGFCGLKVYTKTDNVYFCRAGVHEDHRGQGIHKRLLKKRLDWCRDNDINEVYTYTSYDNYVSINNLIARGFSICEPWFYTESPSDHTFLKRSID